MIVVTVYTDGRLIGFYGAPINRCVLHIKLHKKTPLPPKFENKPMLCRTPYNIVKYLLFSFLLRVLIRFYFSTARCPAPAPFGSPSKASVRGERVWLGKYIGPLKQFRQFEANKINEHTRALMVETGA